LQLVNTIHDESDSLIAIEWHSQGYELWPCSSLSCLFWFGRTDIMVVLTVFLWSFLCNLIYMYIYIYIHMWTQVQASGWKWCHGSWGQGWKSFSYFICCNMSNQLMSCIKLQFTVLSQVYDGSWVEMAEHVHWEVDWSNGWGRSRLQSHRISGKLMGRVWAGGHAWIRWWRRHIAHVWASM
jgi:hypothetical protein